MLSKQILHLKSFYLHNLKYLQAYQLQKALVRLHDTNINVDPTLLLLQHFPVYTVGIRSTLYKSVESNYLKSLGADYVESNRGGLITFHGPGQLVAYPILNLKKLGIGVRKYVCLLEEVIIQLLLKKGISSSRSPHTGVWVEDNKICAMGINVQRYITSHGLALNCNTDLQWFNHIVPCGIRGKGVTSISECLRQDIGVDQILPVFHSTFCEVFGFEFHPTEFVAQDLSVNEKLNIITDMNTNNLLTYEDVS